MEDPTATEFLTYHRWANQILFDLCSQLTDEQLAASVPGSYGSIHRTLGHLVYSEASYYERLTGTALIPPHDPNNRPSVADLRGYAQIVDDALLEIIPRFHSGRLVREEDDGKVYQYHPMVLLIQIIDHGIEHRTNVTTILAQLGIPVPDIDGWGYLEAHLDRLGP